MPLSRLRRIVQARLGERHGVIHSVGTLVGGTAFAQALAMLALPFLTRLYSPDEFSVLAVYTSVLGILVVVACLRLEIAIPLPESDHDAASLLVLALTSALGFSLLVAMLALFFHAEFVSWLRVPTFSPYIWMVPIGMWIASSFAAIQFWSTRKRKFSRIARTRMVQAVGGVSVQVGTGVLGLGPFGLLLGQMINGGAGFIGLARDAWRHDRKVLSTVSFASMRKVLGVYSRFPKYSTFEALANTAGIQAPVIVIAALALGPEAGYLMLAMRVMAAPMALVGSSIAQVYLAHAPEELRTGRLGDFTAKMLTGLMKVGVGPLIFVGIIAGPLAGIAFGKSWARVGELIGWMTPWFIFQFLSSPVSMVMHVAHRQRSMMTLQVMGVLFRIGALLAAYWIDRHYMSETYALTSGIFYMLCFAMYYGISGLRGREFFASLRGAFLVVASWGCLGFFVRFLCFSFMKS